MNAPKETYTLRDLARKTGLSPRTIRSYIAQDLIRGPVSRGRNAQYTEYHLKRLRNICMLKDHYGLSMDEIRKILLVAGDEDIHVMVHRVGSLPDEDAFCEPPCSNETDDARQEMSPLSANPSAPSPRMRRALWRRQQFESQSPSSTDDESQRSPQTRYCRMPEDAETRDEIPAPNEGPAGGARSHAPFHHSWAMPSPPPAPPERRRTPIERLLARLRGGTAPTHPGRDQGPPAVEKNSSRPDAAPFSPGAAVAPAPGPPVPRACRGRSWISIEVTPDVHIAIRGQYDPDDIALFEQVADHMRAVLLGGDEDIPSGKEEPAPPSDPEAMRSRDPENNR